jgi:plastocyanin
MRRGFAFATIAAIGALAAPAGAGAAPTVEASATDFSPKKVAISSGQKVTWKNKSGTHTVTFKQGSFDKPLDPSHKTVRRKFTKPGTYRYVCRFHADLGMKGKVVVK